MPDRHYGKTQFDEDDRIQAEGSLMVELVRCAHICEWSMSRYYSALANLFPEYYQGEDVAARDFRDHRRATFGVPVDAELPRP